MYYIVLIIIVGGRNYQEEVETNELEAYLQSYHILEIEIGGEVQQEKECTLPSAWSSVQTLRLTQDI